jgi:hypothetical protein
MIRLPAAIEHESYIEIFTNSFPNTLNYFDDSYVPANVLSQGRGYWVFYANAASESFIGTPIIDLEVPVKIGWNLISGLSFNASIVDTENILSGGILYGYDNGYVQKSFLQPGFSYWILAEEAGAISFNPISNTLLSEVPISYTPENFSKVVIENQISKQKLFFSGNLDHGVASNQFMLPPVPPAGAFDARIRGNTWLTEDESITIDLQQSDQPLSLRIVGNYSYTVNFLNGSTLVASNRITENEILMINPLIDTINIIQESNQPQDIPDKIALYQNYPNPFNPVTQIQYMLPESSDVSLEVFNIKGQRIEKLVDSRQSAGTHIMSFDASNLSSGVYLYRLTVRSVSTSSVVTQTKKMLLLK